MKKKLTKNKWITSKGEELSLEEMNVYFHIYVIKN